MIYRVQWKKLPGGALIRTEDYTDLQEALAEADIVIAGPSPIEVTVTDHDGIRHFIRVVG